MAMPPGLAMLLQPRRHVDAVAVDVVASTITFTEIHSHPNTMRLSSAPKQSVAGFGVVSQLRCDSAHDARKLCEHAIAGELDDAPLMVCDLPSINSEANLLQLRERAASSVPISRL